LQAKLGFSAEKWNAKLIGYIQNQPGLRAHVSQWLPHISENGTIHPDLDKKVR
jgi:hypothetical protein